MVERLEKEMSAKRKHRPNWDEGFFMARADPEWRPAPRDESEPLKIRSKRFNFEACRKAWAAIGADSKRRACPGSYGEIEGVGKAVEKMKSKRPSTTRSWGSAIID